MRPAAVRYIGSEIHRMGGKLGLDDSTMEFGLRILQQTTDANVDYVSLDRLASACLYVACRVQADPVPLPELADVSRKSQKTIHSQAGDIASTLGLPMSFGDPVEYVERGCDELGLDEETTERMVEIAHQAKDADFHVNRPPSTFAAAILYAGSEIEGLGYTQRDISAVANTSEVTVRKYYSEVFDLVDADLSPDIATPQSVDAALDRLEEALPVPTDGMRERVRELLAANDDAWEAGVSDAGTTAAAYRVAASEFGYAISAEDLADAVGVSHSTVRHHESTIRDGETA